MLGAAWSLNSLKICSRLMSEDTLAKQQSMNVVDSVTRSMVGKRMTEIAVNGIRVQCNG